MITCPKCLKQFSYNYLLIKHNNRKKSCIPKNKLLDNKNNNVSIDDNVDDNVDDNENVDDNVNVNENVDDNVDVNVDVNVVDNVDNSDNSNENDDDNSDSYNSYNSDNNSDEKDNNSDNFENNVDNNNTKNNTLKNKIIKQKKIINEKIMLIDKNIDQLNNKLLINSKNIFKTSKCTHCNKVYNRKYNLIRHIDEYCFYVKNINTELNKLNEEKNNLIIEKNNMKTQTEIKELRNMVAKLLKKNKPNINITNNTINNKTINNNLTLNINSFGNESLAHITNNDYKKFLTGFFPGFIKFIEKIHFDENVPENHNITITNLKSKYVYTYDGEKWITMGKNETIDKFIAKKYNLLAGKLDELEENNQIDDKVLEKFNRFTKNYQDIEAQKNTKNDIMLMIYNNKNKVKIK